MRPYDSAWAEPLGLAAMLGLAFVLAFAWAFVKAWRDVRRERQASEERLARLLRDYACPMGCTDPACPYRVVGDERRAS